MALVYPQASIVPAKEQMLEDWVPTQPWGASGLTRVGVYRFDDPDGVFGLETFLLTTDDGTVLQVPLTYRPEPLDGVEPIATAEHTVLGRRWVYDAMSDGDAVQVFVATALGGGVQAAVEYDDAEGRHVRETSTRVRGSGRDARTTIVALGAITTVSDHRRTTVTSGGLELVLARVVPLDPATGGTTITGTWRGQDEPLPLATVLED